jgi:hypothetical protein
MCSPNSRSRQTIADIDSDQLAQPPPKAAVLHQGTYQLIPQARPPTKSHTLYDATYHATLDAATIRREP